MSIIVIRSESWDDIVFIAQHLIRHNFRGQMDATWELTTSLERLTPDFEINSRFLKNREFWILTQFQRRAHHYISLPPSNQELIEWLSLIQHHGGPTRLLDFTHSIYVATFFAIEMAENDAAIWAINFAKLDEIAEGFLGKNQLHETIYHTNKRHVDFANRCVKGEESKKLVLSIEPNRMNERMAVQQGTFLFPCDLTVSFEENLIDSFQLSLESNFNSVEPTPLSKIGISDLCSSDIVKIIIPRIIHASLIDELNKMNISAASLFPGLDGFARSLRGHLRSLE